MSSVVSDGAIFGMCNPLLDISADTDVDFLAKYDLEANNAILADTKHQPMYRDMIDNYKVEYFAGGAAQNSMRVVQWLLKKPNVTTFFGAVGKDEYSEILREKALEAGVNVCYQYHDNLPTGRCAVVVTNSGNCRSLVADLSAANLFTKCHLDLPENKALLEQANIFYVSGFFLTVSPDSVLSVAELAFKRNKTFCMNLSAPFLCEFFTEPMMKTFPYMDILFANETEAAKFGEVQNFGTNDVREIALRSAALFKKNEAKPRVVIFTQGAGPVIMAKDGATFEFPAIALPPERIIDTNGAGDAFVGGFLAQYVKGMSLEESIKCGIWAATEIIQRHGCSFPKDLDYPENV